MAYLDLRPPPDFDTPRLTLHVEGTEIDWAARWANPQGPWNAFRKLEQIQAIVRYAADNVEHAILDQQMRGLVSRDAYTPLWLNRPYREPEKAEPDCTRIPHVSVTSEVTELVFAITPITTPERDAAGTVLPSEDRVRESIRAIEIFADLLAVTYRSSRRIGSPKIPIGLLPDTSDEIAWLAECRSIRGLDEPEISTEPKWGLDLAQVPPEIVGDRAEGFALLADVFSQDWPTARFRELWRFFERAFALPSGKLVRHLGNFLKAGPQNYSHREVEKWLHMRGPVVHGDRREQLAVAADVQPLLSRMEYAAYDVLLNKKQWRTGDTERRAAKSKASALEEEADSGVKTIRDLTHIYVIKPRYGAGPLRLFEPTWPFCLENQWPAPS